MNTGLAILWCAARVVPRRQRAEWLNEWTAELWYVREQGGRTAGFCWGSFRDAWWMRRNHLPSVFLETPLECLGSLGFIAAACALLCFAMPGARRVLLPFPYPDAERLVLLSPAWETGSRAPAITVGQYRSLPDRGSSFEGLAFYRVVRTRVGEREISLALASENLFPLLGLSALQRRELVLIPADTWLLPGRVDAVLSNDHVIAELPEEVHGYVIGRLLPTHSPGAPQLTVPHGRENHVRISSGPLRSYPLYAMPAVVFICLLVAAATTLPRFRGWGHGRYWRGWMFLGGKIVLLVFIGFFLVLIVQAMIEAEIRPLVMLLYVLAFRWALIDQQQRCPECLRRLLLPVRIGVPSRTFLEWYGTEFLCGDGHGLLQVPGTSTASSDIQHWLHLDDSWATIPHRV